MKKIIIPKSYNYIGVFLTFRCNLNCSYCINKFDKFKLVEELSGEEWIKGLSRIETKLDLPITLQGGEPTLHPDFYNIVNALHKKRKYLDLLTNGTFDVKNFSEKISPGIFKRNAKYASLRFSFHSQSHSIITQKIWFLQNKDYEVGLWALGNFLAERNEKIEEICRWLNIDYREKEFLGQWGSRFYGTYKYKDACLKRSRKKVVCKTSELLIAPSGYIFRCHADLYADRYRQGHILDPEINFPDFLECDNFGYCNPCDIKRKFNRFQEPGHCSVEIKEL